VRKKRNEHKKIMQAKNKSTQAQVMQLKQAVLAQENATIESILFSCNARIAHNASACVHLNGNRA